MEGLGTKGKKSGDDEIREKIVEFLKNQKDPLSAPDILKEVRQDLNACEKKDINRVLYALEKKGEVKDVKPPGQTKPLWKLISKTLEYKEEPATIGGKKIYTLESNVDGAGSITFSPVTHTRLETLSSASSPTLQNLKDSKSVVHVSDGHGTLIEGVSSSKTSIQSQVENSQTTPKLLTACKKRSPMRIAANFSAIPKDESNQSSSSSQLISRGVNSTSSSDSNGLIRKKYAHPQDGSCSLEEPGSHLVIAITNTYSGCCVGSSYDELKGMEHDRNRLSETFRPPKFHLHTIEDCDEKEILENVKHAVGLYKEKKLKYIFVVFSGHGGLKEDNRTFIVSNSGEKIGLEEFALSLSEEFPPDQPKFFLIDSCRKLEETVQQKGKTPDNILIAYAAAEHKASICIKDSGSPWLSSICKSFQNHQEQPILNIIRRGNELCCSQSSKMSPQLFMKYFKSGSQYRL